LAEEAGVALRDIVVHVDDSPRAAARVELACAIAARHGARLIGVFVTPLSPVFEPEVAERAFREFLASVTEREYAAAASAEAAFRRRADAAGLASDWRSLRGDPATLIAISARYADLAVLGQTPPDGPIPAGGEALPERVLIGGGGPALIVPHYGAFATVGERPLVAWDASATAARAVRDAMPLLAAARQVTVLAVNPDAARARHGDAPGSDIALHLARHGVKVETAVTYSDEVGVGDMILSRAADLGADLIVTGAYGHTRLREVLLGGVTRHVLAHMTAPVLMSH
jgi:nucleotide-binding universal stress UspA family protein